MTEFDDKLKAAIDAEYSEEWAALSGEQRLDEQIMTTFRGRNRGMNILMTVVSLLMFAGMLLLIREYVQAQNTKELISYAMLIGFCFCAMGMMKLWIWLEIERNATSREIKRLELQLAMLARKLTGKK